MDGQTTSGYYQIYLGLKLQFFLIKASRIYTNVARKAFKLLEGYDLFREGNVQDCFYHDIPASKSFCFIKSKADFHFICSSRATYFDQIKTVVEEALRLKPFWNMNEFV